MLNKTKLTNTTLTSHHSRNCRYKYLKRTFMKGIINNLNNSLAYTV